MKFDLGHINKIAAISVKMKDDGIVYSYQILKLKKGEIEFIKSENGITEMRALIKKIGKKTPIVLHIQGKGILNRVVDNKENYRHALLMNARLDDFYFTDFVEEEKVYSSVIRKDAVQEILALFAEKHVEVISFCTGPFIAASLAPYIIRDNITVDFTLIELVDNKIVKFEKSEENQQRTLLGEETIPHQMLGAVCVGSNYFNPSPQVVLPEDEGVYVRNFKEAKNKNVFYRFAGMMVAFFFVVLCGNYFYLGYLNTKIEENYAILGEFEDQLAELSTLEDEQNRKEVLLSGSGLLSKKFLSFYLMELSNTVPKDVSLDRVKLRPLMDEIKKRHKIEFQDQLLLVAGKSKSSETLSRWIEDLKEKEWLSSVDILDYTYKKNAGNFELELVLR